MLNRTISSIHGTPALLDDVNRGGINNATQRSAMPRSAPVQQSAPPLNSVPRDVTTDDARNTSPDEQARSTRIEFDAPFVEKNVEMALRELHDSIDTGSLWDRTGTTLEPHTAGDNLALSHAIADATNTMEITRTNVVAGGNGILVTMDNAYAVGAIAGIRVAGDARWVELCNNTYAIETSGDVLITGAIELIGPAAQTPIFRINQDTNPMTGAVWKRLIDIEMALDDPTANISAIHVENDELPSATFPLNVNTIYDHRTIQSTHQARFFAHNISLEGTRDTALTDYGFYILAQHQLNNVGSGFAGLSFNLNTVVATNYASIYGAYIQMPDDATPTNNPLYGIYVVMPGAYSGTDMVGARYTGDARWVEICNTTYAIETSGDVLITGNLEFTGTLTGTIVHSLDLGYSDGRVITVDAGAIELNMAIGQLQAIDIDYYNNPPNNAGGLLVEIGLPNGGGGYVEGVGVYASELALSNTGSYYWGILSTYDGVPGSDRTVDTYHCDIGGSLSGNALTQGMCLDVAPNVNGVNVKVKALNIDMLGGTITNYEYLYGAHIVMPDDATPTNNPLYGIYVVMPGAYSGSDMIGGHFTGNLNTVNICPQYGAIDMLLDSPGYGIYIDNVSIPISDDPKTIIEMDINVGDLTGSSVKGIEVEIGSTDDPTAGDIIGIHTLFTLPNANRLDWTGKWVQVDGGDTVGKTVYGYYESSSYVMNNGGSVYKGAFFDLNNITLTAYQEIHGIHVKMPDDATPTDNPIYGVFVEMPGAYSGTDMVGARYTGDARWVEICNTTYAIETSGDVLITGNLSTTGDADLPGLVRYISLKIEEYDIIASTGDGGAYFACIPAEFNGFSLVSARASYGNAKGSAATTDIQLSKLSGSNHATVVDMLSTLITLGDEWHVADGVIKNDGSEVVATGDIIRVDVDAVRTDSEGLFITIGLKG